LTVGPDGNLYVATVNHRVRVLSPEFDLLREFPNASDPNANNYSFIGPAHIAVDCEGNIYIADPRFGDIFRRYRIVVLSPDGVLLYVFTNTSIDSTHMDFFGSVESLSLDSAGVMNLS
jgi:DNA-binding beta-propeller fold protein YncE